MNARAVAVMFFAVVLAASSMSAQQVSFAKVTIGCDGSTATSSAAAPESGTVDIFGAKDEGVTPPKLLCSVDPEFTDLARRKKVSGTSTISVVVDAAGYPTKLKVVKPLGEGLPKKMQSAAAGLDQNAMAAILKYRFQPGTVRGKPVAVQVNVEVSFRFY